MIKRDDAQTCAQRRSVGTFVELASDEADRAEDAARRPTVSRRGDLSTQDRRAVARPPERFGPWKSVYNRFANWSRRGLWRHILSRYSSTSMTRVRSSTLPSSARTKTLRAGKGVQTNCLGRCRGGFSTKIHVVVDLRGRPLFVTLTPGQRHETTVAQQLIEHAQGRAFLADTAYDSSELIQQLDERGMQVVICQHPRRKTGRRPLLASCTASAFTSSYSSITSNASRALATRLRKTARHYLALLHLACALQWLN